MSERYPPISQEQLKDLFVIDAKAGQVFWRNVAKEHARLNGTEAGSLRGNSKPYWIIKVGGRAYRRSQIVLAFVTGKWPDQCVDHINGNSLDQANAAYMAARKELFGEYA